MMKNLSLHFRQFLGILIISALLIITSSVFAWSGPSNDPPTCNTGDPGCDAPVNVGLSNQFKAGNLTVYNLAAGNNLDVGNIASAVQLFVSSKVGIGKSNPEHKLDVYDEITTGGTWSVLGNFYQKSTGARSAGNAVIGIQSTGEVGTTGSGWNAAYGVFGEGVSSNANSDQYVYGVTGSVKTMPGSEGYALNAEQSGGTSGGVIHGLHIDLGSGGATTKYGIYQKGAGVGNYFEGNVGIGGFPVSDFGGMKYPLGIVGSASRRVGITVENTNSTSRGTGITLRSGDSLIPDPARKDRWWSLSTDSGENGKNDLLLWNGYDDTLGNIWLSVNDGGNFGFGYGSAVSPTQRIEVDGGVRLNTTTTRPSCDLARRGTMWFVQTSSGKDLMSVCAYNSSRVLGWQDLF